VTALVCACFLVDDDILDSCVYGEWDAPNALAGLELVMFNDHPLVDGLDAICNRYSASDGVLIDPNEWWDSHWIKEHIASRLTRVQRLR
jgi:hypothetical protein